MVRMTVAAPVQRRAGGGVYDDKGPKLCGNFGDAPLPFRDPG
jgi:hypothetical protein